MDCVVAALLAMTAVNAGAGALALPAHRLDIVAVGVDQERGEIARAVIGARPGAAIVAASGLQSVGVEFPDRWVVGRAERDVGAGKGWPLVRIEPERRLALGPKTRAGSVARTQHVSERRQASRQKRPPGARTPPFHPHMALIQISHLYRPSTTPPPA